MRMNHSQLLFLSREETSGNFQKEGTLRVGRQERGQPGSVKHLFSFDLLSSLVLFSVLLWSLTFCFVLLCTRFCSFVFFCVLLCSFSFLFFSIFLFFFVLFCSIILCSPVFSLTPPSQWSEDSCLAPWQSSPSISVPLTQSDFTSCTRLCVQQLLGVVPHFNRI